MSFSPAAEAPIAPTGAAESNGHSANGAAPEAPPAPPPFQPFTTPDGTHVSRLEDVPKIMGDKANFINTLRQENAALRAAEASARAAQQQTTTQSSEDAAKQSFIADSVQRLVRQNFNEDAAKIIAEENWHLQVQNRQAANDAAKAAVDRQRADSRNEAYAIINKQDPTFDLEHPITGPVLIGIKTMFPGESPWQHASRLAQNPLVMAFKANPAAFGVAPMGGPQPQYQMPFQPPQAASLFPHLSNGSAPAHAAYGATADPVGFDAAVKAHEMMHHKPATDADKTFIRQYLTSQQAG